MKNLKYWIEEMYNISELFTFMLPISIVTVEAATPCEFSVKNPIRTFFKLSFWCSGLLYPIGRQIQYHTYFEGQSHESSDWFLCHVFFIIKFYPVLWWFLLAPSRIFSKIRNDNCNSRCTSGVNDTGKCQMGKCLNSWIFHILFKHYCELTRDCPARFSESRTVGKALGAIQIRIVFVHLFYGTWKDLRIFLDLSRFINNVTDAVEWT